MIDTKARIKALRLRYCDLASEIGVSENTVYRWMRMPLSAEQKDRLDTAIDILKEKRIQELMHV